MADISIFVATGSRRVSGATAGGAGELRRAGSEWLLWRHGRKDQLLRDTARQQLLRDVDTAPQRDGTGRSRARPDVVLYDTGYTAEQLAAVPLDAANLSLGCGNPTAMASLRPGETVLDIGSGAGIDALYAARRVGPPGRVIGLDMTPSMIERAQRNAEPTRGFGQVEFRLGQAEAMPVEDGTVDVILSNCVINLARTRAASSKRPSGC